MIDGRVDENRFRADQMYGRWLVDRVFGNGWSTLKCARFIGADPELVRWDFDRMMEIGGVRR